MFFSKKNEESHSFSRLTLPPRGQKRILIHSDGDSLPLPTKVAPDKTPRRYCPMNHS